MTPVEFRRHLHRHPELSFRETESARFIAEALREAGIPCRPIAGTGVLAKIEGRGDMRRAAGTGAASRGEPTSTPCPSANRAARRGVPRTTE